MRGSQLPVPTRSQAPRVLFVDNLDSFSLNVANAFSELGAEVIIVNGRGPSSPDADEVLGHVRPTHLVLGPGPGRPEASPLTQALAQRAAEGQLWALPVLGICLGHQSLGLAFGFKVVPSPLGAVHGVPEEIHHDGTGLFRGLPSPARMVRYNSLVLETQPNQQASEIQINAFDESRSLIMGIQHRSLPIFGVQFHPDSAGSHGGKELLKTFLSRER